MMMRSGYVCQTNMLSENIAPFVRASSYRPQSQVFFDRFGNQIVYNYTGGSVFSVIKEGVNRVKKFVTGREGAGPALRKILEQYGNVKIVNAYVCRKPIFSELEKIASLVSGNKFDEVKGELYYDKMFHLFIVLELENGKFIKLEKNEEVEAQESSVPQNDDKKGEKCMQVNLNGKTVTLNDLIQKGEESQGKSKFWDYEIANNNCQVFIKTILKANGLLTPELEKFIIQDVNTVFKALPAWSQKVATVLPRLKQRINILLRGAGTATSKEHYDHIVGGNLHRMRIMYNKNL